MYTNKRSEKKMRHENIFVIHDSFARVLLLLQMQAMQCNVTYLLIELRIQIYIQYIIYWYRDHPRSGGAAQVSAMTQVSATPATACFSSKRKLLMGLQTTTKRSTASTTRDHRAISPGDRADNNRDAAMRVINQDDRQHAFT